MFSLFIVVTTDAEDCVTESGIEADVVVKVFVFVLIIDVLVAGVEDDDDDVMIDAAAVVVVVVVIVEAVISVFISSLIVHF